MAVAEFLAKLIATTRAAHPERPALIGVGGAQGSGKTTICSAFAQTHPSVAHFSLDDVYLTRAQRVDAAKTYSDGMLTIPSQDPREQAHMESMAAELHALLLTRGPPGSHDLPLAAGIVARLRRDLPTPLPRFDKTVDDRAPESDWPIFKGPAEAVLIDGWCLGAEAPHENSTKNNEPLNDLEKSDASFFWRSQYENELRGNYARFFAAFDEIIYLQAPNFEIVRRWRGQQEEAMLGRPMTQDEAAALDRFIMHYERVTRSMLDGGVRARWIVKLDEDRNVIAIEGPR